jgi:hypothetical protein
MEFLQNAILQVSSIIGCALRLYWKNISILNDFMCIDYRLKLWYSQQIYDM